MSTRDTHPEAWLDERPETLREDERRELSRHLRQCDACKLHEQLTPSLMDQLQLKPGDSARINIAVADAVRQFEAQPLLPLETRPRWSTAKKAALSAAAAALMALSAAAAMRSARHDAADAAPAPPLRQRPPVEVVVERPSPDVPPPSTVVGELPGQTESEPRAVASPVGPRKVPRAAAATQPADLFARANVLRRAREFDRAETVYRQLQSGWPKSPEAALSKILLGRMYLDQLGDAPAALRQFDGYVRDTRHAELRDEALIGRALALGRLGRHADERAAWEQFVREFPNSVYAPKAQTRLRALGVR
jgi:TolA-binding protein